MMPYLCEICMYWFSHCLFVKRNRVFPLKMLSTMFHLPPSSSSINLKNIYIKGVFPKNPFGHRQRPNNNRVFLETCTAISRRGVFKCRHEKGKCIRFEFEGPQQLLVSPSSAFSFRAPQLLSSSPIKLWCTCQALAVLVPHWFRLDSTKGDFKRYSNQTKMHCGR